MEQYLIDSNVVSDYLSDSFVSSGMAFMDTVIDAIPNISVIAQIELLCWDTDLMTTQSVKDFIDDSVVMDISANAIEYCVVLRKGKRIKTPDAIIAATALANGYTLITANVKDFANIKGLRLINPNKV